jgi:ESX secretion-associated protein EspJ
MIPAFRATSRMPMQMAQQADQLPMQLIEMMAAVPQGIMQGAQGLIGQFGGPGGQLDKSSEYGSNVQPGEVGLDSHRAEAANEKPDAEGTDDDRDRERDHGAQPGQPGAERAPGTGDSKFLSTLM